MIVILLLNYILYMQTSSPYSDLLSPALTVSKGRTYTALYIYLLFLVSWVEMTNLTSLTTCYGLGVCVWPKV